MFKLSHFTGMSVLNRFGGKSDADKNDGLTKLCGAVGVC